MQQPRPPAVRPKGSAHPILALRAGPGRSTKNLYVLCGWTTCCLQILIDSFVIDIDKYINKHLNKNIYNYNKIHKQTHKQIQKHSLFWPNIPDDHSRVLEAPSYPSEKYQAQNKRRPTRRKYNVRTNLNNISGIQNNGNIFTIHPFVGLPTTLSKRIIPIKPAKAG